MIDGHVHLERGPLSREYVLRFVDEALNKGIDDLQILDHTHRFKEFKEMYEPMKKIGGRQKEWLDNDFRNSLDEYLELIKEMKGLDLPIRVTYGLEVCFQKSYLPFLKEILGRYDFDFLVGSVHSVNNIAYDSGWSVEELWTRLPVDYIYTKYFEESYALIESGLFTQIGHPDTIKMFGYRPSFDVLPYYDKLARLANRHGVKLENNTGCHYRYNHPDIGLARDVLQVFKDNHSQMITVSDAHRPEDVGSYIKDIWDITMA